MKIAITGATGFIGQQVVREALNQSYEVVAITRHPNPVLPVSTKLTVVKIDLLKTDMLAKAIAGCDAVIHLAASLKGTNQHQQTLKSTHSLLKAMNHAGVKRLVLISSIAVLDYSKQAPLSTIDENTDLCSTDSELGGYARMKRDQEKLCQRWQGENKMLLIIRPGLVYDDDFLSDAHAGFIKSGFGILAKHQGTVPLVHVQQAAKQITLATGNPKLENDTFHLLGNPPVSQDDYLQQLKRHEHYRLALPLPWQLYNLFTQMVRGVLTLIKKQDRIPDSFRKNSVSARQKPFYFSSDKADKQLV